MREFVCQARVILAVRKIRDDETKDGSNCHIMPMIFKKPTWIKHRYGCRDMCYVRR